MTQCGSAAIPARDRPVVYVVVPGLWVGWVPGRLFLVPYPTALANYSGLMLCVSEADKAHTWQIPITEFLVFVPVSLVAAARDDVLMSNIANDRIVAERLGVLVPTADSSARWINDLGFFPIFCKTESDSVPAYVSFHRRQEVHRSCVDLEDPFAL